LWEWHAHRALPISVISPLFPFFPLSGRHIPFCSHKIYKQKLPYRFSNSIKYGIIWDGVCPDTKFCPWTSSRSKFVTK
jgi:hypothetical protein